MTSDQGSPDASLEPRPHVVAGYTEDHGLSPEQLRARVETALGEDWSSLPDGDAVARLGRLIDAAADMKNAEATRTAIARADALLARPLAPSDRATVHYFAANAWAAVDTRIRDGATGPAWDRPEVAQQIVHLRHALQAGTGAEAENSPDAPPDVARLRSCQIATNLGNLLSGCGRLVDAVAYWDAALAVDPGFPMALGNRGYGLLQYARLVHDPGHQAWHLREAFAGLTRATSPEHAWRLHGPDPTLVSRAAISRDLPTAHVDAPGRGDVRRMRLVRTVVWSEVALVAAGGAAGCVLRYLVADALRQHSGAFPWNTLAINGVGSFVLGALLGALPPGHPGQLLAGTGVCGGFTTFSTFSTELVAHGERRAPRRAGVSAGASLVLGLPAAGTALGRARARMR